MIHIEFENFFQDDQRTVIKKPPKIIEKPKMDMDEKPKLVEEKDFKGKLPAEIGTDYNYKRKIVWKNAIGFLLLHIAAIGGFYFVPRSNVWTTIFMVTVSFVSGMGVTMGAHRMYSHKAFKATVLARFVLVLLHTTAGQNCMYIWVRDHRQHHKYSDTDADPHNAHRGFFFSHIGWLMSRKHPAVIAKGKTIDMSDLEADSIVMLQKRHYKLLYFIFALLIPVWIPVFLWDEYWVNSFFICYLIRTILVLNITWSVNSVAHLYGNKPFDRFMMPVESRFVSIVSVGEGWHNYHHAFPWDYRAAELGERYSPTTFVIDFFSRLGVFYDLRTTPYHMVRNRAARTGDGSHSLFGKYAKKVDAGETLDEQEIQQLKDGQENVEKRSILALDKDLTHRIVSAQG